MLSRIAVPVLRYMPEGQDIAWLVVTCAVALIAALAVSHRLRVQCVASRVQTSLEERAAERVRLSRDLHDTLLQALQGLLLRFHFAAEQIPEHEPARAMMRDALIVADRVAEEGRNRVRTLRSELSGRDLSTALAEVGSELNWERRVQFSVTAAGFRDIVGGVVVSELYLIGRETIVNAFRHANASRIRVEITSDGKQIQLCCTDDGSGIDPEFAKARCGEEHSGLATMRDRARKIGARFECWSARGYGTEITVTAEALPRNVPR